MKLLIVSEYSAGRGSGYTTMTDGLVRELGERGHDIIVVAFSYDGAEHTMKAGVVRTEPQAFKTQMQVIRAGFKPEALIVIMDISYQHRFSDLQASFETPYVGIFPIESDPLVHPSEWSNCVDTMHAALCESRFGTKLLNDEGISARYFPVGVSDFWRPPTAEERQAVRAARNISDRFVVLTVADNHERKNLPVHYAAIALLAGEKIEWPPASGRQISLPRRRQEASTYYVLNTKRNSIMASGYLNYALSERFGISERCMIMDHGRNEGLTAVELRELYWSADAMLLLSKAEGLGLPVLEAMRCRLPVVGTDCTGIAESLGDKRGYLIRPEYVHLDPFHNQYRRWADPVHAAEALSGIAKGGASRKMLDKAEEYALGFTWSRSTDVLEEAINELKGRETTLDEATRSEEHIASEAKAKAG